MHNKTIRIHGEQLQSNPSSLICSLINLVSLTKLCSLDNYLFFICHSYCKFDC